MEKLKPADIFLQGMTYIHQKMAPLGYKLLKSNVIKKKKNDLTYELHFHSSHYNFIDQATSTGNVVLEIYCGIYCKKEALYKFNFTASRSASRRFNILSPDLTLNKGLLDELYQQIQAYFLGFIDRLEKDAGQAIATLDLIPQIVPSDYSWTISLNRNLIAQFGNERTLQTFDDNCLAYNSLEQKVMRNIESFYVYARERIDLAWCQSYPKENIDKIYKRTYDLYMAEEHRVEWHILEDEFIKDIPLQNKERFVICVWLFCTDFLSNENLHAKEPDLLQDVEEFRKHLFG